MVKVATYFAMTLGAFVFWQSMDKVHVWIALHQDEKEIGVKLCVGLLRVLAVMFWYCYRSKFGMILIGVSLTWQQERLEREMEIKRVREEMLREQAKLRETQA
ncbi:hypothetical protein DVH24_008644 [Malus domestica]|uniref:Uncharacterized protein n=1 Tax=Malus domestica TaxID=3750 RepID=A0A498JQM4_MALDO|nr:hypothetical protein DVH24_008644 [Malus domestica]